jgi:hypothetical protein
LESYIELIKDYDRKTKELMLEANDLKSFIINNFMCLEGIVCELNLTQHSNESETGNNSTGHEDKLDLSSSVAVGDDFEDWIRLPFESTHKKLSQKFEEKFRAISNIISNRTLGLTKKNRDAEDLSLSTINLSETKTTTGCGLNDTFTLKKDRDECGSSRPESSITSSSQSSINSSDGMMDPIKADQIATSIYNERMRLAEEKRLFYEEKLRIEQEAKYQRNASIKLEKTVSILLVYK